MTILGMATIPIMLLLYTYLYSLILFRIKICSSCCAITIARHHRHSWSPYQPYSQHQGITSPASQICRPLLLYKVSFRLTPNERVSCIPRRTSAEPCYCGRASEAQGMMNSHVTNNEFKSIFGKGVLCRAYLRAGFVRLGRYCLTD